VAGGKRKGERTGEWMRGKRGTYKWKGCGLGWHGCNGKGEPGEGGRVNKKGIWEEGTGRVGPNPYVA